MAANPPKSTIRNSGHQLSDRGKFSQGIIRRLTKIKRFHLRAARSRKRPFPYPSTNKTPSKAAKSSRVQVEPIENRVQIAVASCAVENKETASNIDNKKGDRIKHWIQEGNWPKEYIDLKADMDKPFARKKSVTSIRPPTGEPSTYKPSQGPRDKSAPYKDPAYIVILEDAGSYLKEHVDGILDEAEPSIRTLFHKDLFAAACEKFRDRNEARIISDIGPLITPSAETLATYGDTKLNNLIVSMNERWNESIPLTTSATRPQPDFSVGFKRSAFTPVQLKKLEPFTGNVLAARKLSSLFLATWRMYFPFFACEVKSSTEGLDIADRRNTNSMTLALRGTKTSFYRHPIKKFDFTDEEGKEKWTAYRFTKNIYDIWMPKLLVLICDAIAQVPEDINFGVSISDSLTSTAGADDVSELPDAQETTTSVPSSRGTKSLKRRKPPPVTTLQKEKDGQKETINKLIEQVDLLKQAQHSLTGQNQGLIDKVAALTALIQSKTNADA